MFYLVQDGFQQAMGITLKRGRFITAQDNEQTPIVIDIDEVFARQFFANQNPIGRHIHIAGFDVEAEIVGVVGHVRQWGPGNDAKDAIEAQFYYPFMQLPPKMIPLVADGSAVVLRTQNDPTTIVAALRRAVSELDPGAVIYAVDTMDGIVTKSLAARRLSLVLLAGFAVLALALSSWVFTEFCPTWPVFARERSECAWRLVPIAAISSSHPHSRSTHGAGRRRCRLRACPQPDLTAGQPALRRDPT